MRSWLCRSSTATTQPLFLCTLAHRLLLNIQHLTSHMKTTRVKQVGSFTFRFSQRTIPLHSHPLTVSQNVKSTWDSRRHYYDTPPRAESCSPHQPSSLPSACLMCTDRLCDSTSTYSVTRTLLLQGVFPPCTSLASILHHPFLSLQSLLLLCLQLIVRSV